MTGSISQIESKARIVCEQQQRSEAISFLECELQNSPPEPELLYQRLIHLYLLRGQISESLDSYFRFASHLEVPSSFHFRGYRQIYSRDLL